MDSISLSRFYDAFRSGLPEGEKIIDVREKDEFSAGHVPGSANFPLSSIDRSLDELRKFRKIYVHCQAGGRAKKASDFLIANGIDRIVCVADGGFGDWEKSGYPVEK